VFTCNGRRWVCAGSAGERAVQGLILPAKPAFDAPVVAARKKPGNVR
jgi:hypothetical protein